MEVLAHFGGDALVSEVELMCLRVPANVFHCVSFLKVAEKLSSRDPPAMLTLPIVYRYCVVNVKVLSLLSLL